MKENAEIGASGLYEAWGHGDIPGPVQLFYENVEYVNPVGAIEPGTRMGVTQFAPRGPEVAGLVGVLVGRATGDEGGR